MLLKSKLSLAQNVTLSSGLAALVLLGVISLLLITTFSQLIERRFDDALQDKVLDLLAKVDASADTLNMQSTNPSFREPISGWYWLIVEQENVLAASPSLVGGRPSNLLSLPDDGWHLVQGPGGNALRVLKRTIAFTEEGRSFTFIVSGPQRDINNDVSIFTQLLLMSLTLFFVLLLAVVWVQLFISLHPIKNMTQQLTAIRAGSQARLQGKFPKELQQIGAEINLLMDHSEQVVERGRLQAANIAHSLKTPLAVMNNQLDAMDNSEILRQQLRQLNQTVQLYLARAQTSQKLYVTHSVNIASSLDELCMAVGLAYPNKRVVTELLVNPASAMVMEQGDFDELFANLIDNAMKWCTTRVHIRYECKDDKHHLYIDDDGPGIPDNQVHKVTRVGVRLDESVAGSGVGLAIVQDILAIYAGSLTFETSAWQGSSAHVQLPVTDALQ